MTYMPWEEMLDNRWICLVKGTYLLELDVGGLRIERHQSLPREKAWGGDVVCSLGIDY